MKRQLKKCESARVTVLVDNVSDLLSSLPANVSSPVHNLALNKPNWKFAGNCLCCANWGLALAIDIETGSNHKSILFDAGPDRATLKRNADLLGYDLGNISDFVLSHGHWDHAGGIPAVVKARRPAYSDPLLVHATPEMFVRRGIRGVGGVVVPFRDPPSRESMISAGVSIQSDRNAHCIAGGHIWVSGEIPRRTEFEIGFPNHLTWNKIKREWEDDPLILDERWVAIHVAGKGLLIFSACSHAGIINVLSDVRRTFGDVPIYSVIGGFHLSGVNENIIGPTIENLANFSVVNFVPLHCTGWRAVTALSNRFGDIVVPGSVGQVHHF